MHNIRWKKVWTEYLFQKLLIRNDICLLNMDGDVALALIHAFLQECTMTFNANNLVWQIK